MPINYCAAKYNLGAHNFGMEHIVRAVHETMGPNPLMETGVIKAVKALMPLGTPGADAASLEMYPAIRRDSTGSKGLAHSEILCGATPVPIIVITADMDTDAKLVAAAENASEFSVSREREYGKLALGRFIVVIEREDGYTDMLAPARWKARAIRVH